MAEELTDIISAALEEIDAPAAEPVVEVEEETEIVEDLEEPTDLDDGEEGDPEGDEDESDSDEADETLDQVFEVRVDGEPVEVTLREALAGYQRQADYTRKTQALAAEKQELEAEKEGFSAAIEQLQSLDEAWSENPVDVLSQFALSTANPTHAVALLIKDLASQGALEAQFLEMFGITAEVRQAWMQETETSRLRRQVQQTESKARSRTEELEQEAAVQAAVVEFERQIDDILDTEGLDLTVSQRKEFRSQLARYARDNELTNLKAAYKAMKYEETVKKKTLAAKTAERVKAKKATSASTRSGSPAGSPVDADNTDLRSVIAAAMKESSI
jgi:hypothetical protein